MDLYHIQSLDKFLEKKYCPECRKELRGANDPKYKENIYYCNNCQGYYPEHQVLDMLFCPICNGCLQPEAEDYMLEVWKCPICGYIISN